MMMKLTKNERPAPFQSSHSTLPVPATLGLCATHTCCVPQFPFCHCAGTTLTERGRQEQASTAGTQKGAHGSPAAHRPPQLPDPLAAQHPPSPTSRLKLPTRLPQTHAPRPTPNACDSTSPVPPRPAPSSQRNLPLAVSEHPAPGLGGAEAPRPPQIWLWRLASARRPDPACVRAEPGGEAAAGGSCRTTGRDMVSRTRQGGRIRGKGCAG